MTTPEMPTSVAGIANLLERASHAYYNGQPHLMDDAAFDALAERLRELDPSHPFLAAVGAPPPSSDAVELPYPMASLDKIKPGQDALGRFLSKHSDSGFVLSEKLDGLSALWCPAKRDLYLRGDGKMGQPISQFANYIRGLKVIPHNAAIRGELILPRGATDLGARATLNGLLHQKTAAKDKLGQVHFIAYEVVAPSYMTRKEQFEWLASTGFETPWWKMATTLTEEECRAAFVERRAASAYDTDGIVVGAAGAVPVRYTDVQNPKDCVAFKMVVDDQSAVTTLREVIWGPSAQGYLIPRLRFDPVKIGGASIEFCTGHNARTVVDKGLGPGAQVKIRRSGDVIPTLDQVLVPVAPSLPADVNNWAWLNDSDQSTHICSKTVTTEQTTSQILHFAKTHSIPSLGPANCALLVKGGIIGPATLWNATAAALSTILGPKTGETVHAALRTAMAATTEIALMVSSSVLPRGVGETKLKTLFAMYPDPRTWRAASTTPPGWTETSFREFQTEYTKYEQWRAAEISWIPYPVLTATKAPVPALAAATRTVCFTGFRDKELEELLKQHNFEIVSGITLALNILVVPDGAATQSEKVKKALKYGTVEVIGRSDFVKKYVPKH